MTIDKAVEAARMAADLGIPAIATFPDVEMALRDQTGSQSLEANNLINLATRAIKREVPNIGIITDVALDPFTSHGHDGICAMARSSMTRRLTRSSARPSSRPMRAPTSSPHRT